MDIDFSNWKLFRRSLKHIWQYIIWGFSDDETWSLDYTVLKFLYPRLKRFRELNRPNVPYNRKEEKYYTIEEWNNILDNIIFYIEYFLYEKGSMKETRKLDKIIIKKTLNMTCAEIDEKYEKGAKLFMRHFHDLWW